METVRLRPNQVIFRVQKLGPLLHNLHPETVFDILTQLGHIEAMQAGGYLPRADGTYAEQEAGLAETDPAEFGRRALKKQVEAGNPQAIALWTQQYGAAEEIEDKFRVVVNITDYRIKDTSLARIVLECDREPLEQLANAFAERLELDGCPRHLFMPFLAALKPCIAWVHKAAHGRKKTSEPIEVEDGQPN